MTAGRQLRFWLIGAILFVVALYLLGGILAPFVAGMGVAYFLDPTCDRLERAGLSRTLATTVVTVIFGILVVAALVLIVPMLLDQIGELLEWLPRYLDTLVAAIRPLVRELMENLNVQGTGQLKQAVSEQAGPIVGWVGGAVAGVVTGSLALANILSLVFITPVVAFYLLRDWDRLVAWIDSCLPRDHAEVIRDQARKIDHTLAGWVRGQATVCLLLAAYYSIGLTVIGLKFGLAIGLLTGALSFIPYVGTITGFILSMAVALSQYADWGPVVGVAAFYIVGQMIEGNFLTPLLVGDRVGLHPVWVIFALLAGGALFGFVGVLLAVPVAAVIGVVARFALGQYLQSRYYRSVEAPPGPVLRSGGDDLPPPIA